MIISTLEGSAEVTAFGQSSVAIAGSRVRVPIDVNLKASGPPSPPEPYDLTVMQPLPAQHLPVKVTPVAPIATLPANFISSTWRITWSAWTITGSTKDDTCIGNAMPSQLITIASDSTSLLWNGRTYTGSGGSFHSERTIPVQNSSNTIDQISDFHLTSATHGEGLNTYEEHGNHHCYWMLAFQLDQVGGPALSTTAATVSP
jgi:hypothetical protein